MNLTRQAGFTLLEMSVVLAIIGLLMGAVLVGKDLIRAAAVHGQISQLAAFQAGVHLFESRYQALPGDIPNVLAVRAGLAPRGTMIGEGDGNGVITADNGGSYWNMATGELGMFWSDLTYANGMNLNFIPGSFRAATPVTTSNELNMSMTAVDLYFPQSVIANGSIYVDSINGTNYFGLQNIPGLSGGPLATYPLTQIAVADAAAIDSKIDDGYPLTGQVVVNWFCTDDGFCNGPPFYQAYATLGAVAGNSGTCWDNGGVAGALPKYSITFNAGKGQNCGGMWFEFQ
jgi:prepilin-type N-terminal cleavage/methylation domain-containing protein